ncbi:unnamed protein product, partial [Effrenium voratum]
YAATCIIAGNLGYRVVEDYVQSLTEVVGIYAHMAGHWRVTDCDFRELWFAQQRASSSALRNARKK